MNIQSYEALSRGIEGYRRGVESAEDKKLRAAMLKRQLEQDGLAEQDRTFDRSMKTKGIELAERREKRERDKMLSDNATGAVDDVEKQIDAMQKRRESAARMSLMEAQAAAVSAKPANPMAGELAGIEAFADTFAGALEENQQAIAAIQNPALQQDPAAFQAANRRVLKAQLRLSGLQQMSQNWGKTAGKESTVKIKLPGEDGRSEATMEVPASQWGPQHPLYTRFHGGEPNGGGAAPGKAASPQDQQALAWAQQNPNDPRAAAILQRLRSR